MKKKFVSMFALVVVLILAGTLLCSCGSTEDDLTPTDRTVETTGDAETAGDEEVYRITMGNTLLGNILAFIADDSGIFEKEGIEPEFMTFQSSADGLNAVMNGS